MCEGEGPDTEPLVHPEDAEARPDGVARLDGDEAGDLPPLMSRYQL